MTFAVGVPVTFGTLGMEQVQIVLEGEHVRDLHVEVTENGWDSAIWSCLAIAARELERLMDAPASTGSDGRFRPQTAWTPQPTSPTFEAA